VMLTGLIDDVLRYGLLATLLTLLPRPGTAALAALTQWLLSGIALGSFGPSDLLFVTGRVLWLEGGLWLTGITRSRAWLEEHPVRRWLRLALALGGASAAANATGLILHVTLYRLFLADWYVAMVILGPGFLYVVLAVAVAVPLSDSLRRIQR
jgi:cbb3-type cytochrome oxidase subunit 1